MKSLLCALVFTLAVSSLAAQDPNDLSPYSDALLVSEVQAIQPGEPFTVALRLTMDDGWHSYWVNPGDAGSATIIEWDLPPGFTAGEIQWPYPHYIEEPPLASYGYDDEVFLLVEVVPPDDLTAGQPVRLAALADWVVCKRICHPAMANVELDLPVTMGTPPVDEQWQPQIADARGALPIQFDDWRARAWSTGSGHVLELTPPSGWNGRLDGARFFAGEEGLVSYAAPQTVSALRGTYRLALTPSEFASETPERLRGVVVAPDGTTWDGQARALAVDAAIGPVPVQDAGSGRLTLAVALLFAFIGGLLLNLMPCVFPVLSIKILGIVEHGGADKKRIRNHGVAFAAGVVAAFWALAAALLIIRAGGTQLGWGFQLQSPYFVAFLAGLFLLIGLNLMGVFQVGLALTRLGGHLDEPSGYAGSVMSGVLATIVATPCIAPFMGAALGFALTQTALTTLLVFGFLGMGMALPYLLLSMAPTLVQRLPRPGPWMETLRQILAFPLFATAVWLVWVFGRQTGVDGVTYLVMALLLLGYAAWIVGRWNRLTVSRRTYFATRSVAITAVAAAVALTVKGTRGPQGPADVDGMWEEWSSAAVASHRSAGRPVFVDFTADWCLTCKVNERVVLATDEIESAFRERDVALLEADWTRRDPAITQALESFGVGGVPLYVLYPADPSGTPRVLPVILTKSIVLNALEEIGN